MKKIVILCILSLLIAVSCQDNPEIVNCIEGEVVGPDPGCVTIIVNPEDSIYADELYLIRINNVDSLIGISTPTLPDGLKVNGKHIFFRIDVTKTFSTACNHLFGTTYPFFVIENVNDAPCLVSND